MMNDVSLKELSRGILTYSGHTQKSTFLEKVTRVY